MGSPDRRLSRRRSLAAMGLGRRHRSGSRHSDSVSSLYGSGCFFARRGNPPTPEPRQPSSEPILMSSVPSSNEPACARAVTGPHRLPAAAHRAAIPTTSGPRASWLATP